MIKQLTKTSKLHKNELRQIRHLIDRSADMDGFKIKAYWHVLENRMTMEFNDFFYYLDGNLIGYLSLYTFETNEAEMSAIIHPKYRQQRLFKKMLAEATLELRQRGIAKYLWICPKGSAINSEYIQRFNGQYIFSQVEMIAKREPIPRDLPDISLRLATPADLNELAKIGAISFNSSFTETRQRFGENMKEKNRRVWLLSAPGADTIIGKIHVRFDEGRVAFIHDLCILPEFRGKKYAMAMILKIMQMMREADQKKILLDVECHNEGALKLYDQCGFDTTSAYDFWRLPVDRFPLW